MKVVRVEWVEPCGDDWDVWRVMPAGVRFTAPRGCEVGELLRRGAKAIEKAAIAKKMDAGLWLIGRGS